MVISKKQRFVEILENHCIQWRDNGNWLDVCNVTTHQYIGTQEEWIICPMTIPELIAWLNY